MQSRNNYTPDVLDCLANLSNDEVFTPPAVVNQMLDMLPQEVFMSKKTTFIDPFTKSGVFLREITKRLLENQVPNYKATADEIERVTKEAIQDAVRTGTLDLDDKDYEDKARRIGDAAIKAHPDANKFLNFEIDLQDALDHILTNQVFGIAITELTAQLARRSLYCSKDASGRYSVAGTAFGVNTNGNIRFEAMGHIWDKQRLQNGTYPKGTSCKYCGATAEQFDRPDDLEAHAYEFIHKDIEEIRKELGDMEFTVVCGNPPYQMNDGGAGASAVPIYQKFVEQAKRLNPKYLTMIIPARWYAGGKGLDKFRKDMLEDKHISHLVDYVNAKDCFAGNSIGGGVCYFLRDRDYQGDCAYTNIHNGEQSTQTRNLGEYDVFVRYNEALSIIRKIDLTADGCFAENVGSRNPFGFSSSCRGTTDKKTDYVLHTSAENGYVKESDIVQGKDIVDKYKIMISKVSAEHAGEPDKNGMFGVLSTTEILNPKEVCTDSYIIAYSCDTLEEAQNCRSYMCTKFFRFVLLQAVTSINLSKDKFQFIPNQDFSRPWTDADLYAKYNLSQSEIDFIESMIKEKN